MPIFSNIVNEEQFKHYRNGFCDCLEELEDTFNDICEIPEPYNSDEEYELCEVCEMEEIIKGYCDNGQCNKSVCIECEGYNNENGDFYCCEECAPKYNEQTCYNCKKVGDGDCMIFFFGSCRHYVCEECEEKGDSDCKCHAEREKAKMMLKYGSKEAIKIALQKQIDEGKAKMKELQEKLSKM